MIDALTHHTSTRLWRAHSADLLRFATVLVGPADAHDIVVDAFLRSAARIEVGSVADERSYLFRAVANQAHDLRRARRRRWQRDLAAIQSTATESAEPHTEVIAAVAQLTVAQRAVVYLAYWEDRTERDIARTLGVSPGTVRRHLVRAKAHLRKALQ